MKKTAKTRRVYLVLVHGSEFDRSTDELVAHEIARLLRNTWNNVTIKPSREKI